MYTVPDNTHLNFITTVPLTARDMGRELLAKTRSEPIHGARTRILAGDGLSKKFPIHVSVWRIIA